ncbi:hypothetical protein D7X33_24295, partial [Butyricicoccus sp. 1XD8-22]
NRIIKDIKDLGDEKISYTPMKFLRPHFSGMKKFHPQLSTKIVDNHVFLIVFLGSQKFHGRDEIFETL